MAEQLARDISNPPTASELHITLLTPGPGRLEVAKSLLARGADINGLHEYFPPGPMKGGGSLKQRDRVTPLYSAAKRGDFETVQFLIEQGADPSAKNMTAVTILSAPFPEHMSRETLGALDGMRMSDDMRIVELAEHLYGVESDQETRKRENAFKDVPRWPPVHPGPELTEEEGVKTHGKKKWEALKKQKEERRQEREKKREAQKLELERLRRERKEGKGENGVGQGRNGDDKVMNEEKGKTKKRKQENEEGQERKLYDLRRRS